MEKQRVHIATTLFGLLLALVLICANVLIPQNNAVSKDKAKTEQKKTAEQQFTFVSAPTITPPSPAVIECCLFAHCIFEIDQEQQFQDEASSTTFIQPQKLFHTLFRVIISPNAP